MEDSRLSTEEAAKFLGFKENTLRNSRHTGILAGVKAPTFLKVGRKVLYEQSVVSAWIGQFEPQGKL